GSALIDREKVSTTLRYLASVRTKVSTTLRYQTSVRTKVSTTLRYQTSVRTKVSTTLRYQTSVRLAPPLRQRCDGDHKNALFCQVLQRVCACMTARPVACLLSRTDALPSRHRGRVREARVK